MKKTPKNVSTSKIFFYISYLALFLVSFLQNLIKEDHLDSISLLKQKLDGSGSGVLKSGSRSAQKPGSIRIRNTLYYFFSLLRYFIRDDNNFFFLPMLPHLLTGAAAGVTVVFFASEWKGKDLLQYVPIYNRHSFHTQPGAGQVLDIFMSYRVLYCNLSNKKTAI